MKSLGWQIAPPIQRKITGVRMLKLEQPQKNDQQRTCRVQFVLVVAAVLERVGGTVNQHAGTTNTLHSSESLQTIR